jgi:hypothetical protein
MLRWCEEKGPETMTEAIASSTFRIFGVDVRCHVLDNGQRIIEEDSVVELLEAMASPDNRDLGDMDAFARWQKGL